MINVLHILSVYSSDGSSGGPVRVALSQIAALRDTGVQSTLIGLATKPERAIAKGSPGVRLFAGLHIPLVGPAGAMSPSLLWWLLWNHRKFDLVHVHLSRDLVTLPAALIVLGTDMPFVTQTHGMIDGSTRRLARVIDQIATIRILRRANRVLALSGQEVADLQEVAGSLQNASVMPNTTNVPEHVTRPRHDRPEVLFLARMHARKRPELFVQMAVALLSRGYDVDFRLVGPDEGATLGAMKIAAQAGFGDRIIWEGSIPANLVSDRMAAADIYVLPAEKEPFGLTVIEALAVGTPVVLTDDAAIARDIDQDECGIVFDGTSEALATAVARYLDDPDLWARHSANARQAAAARYSSGRTGPELLTQYHQAVRGRAV